MADRDFIHQPDPKSSGLEASARPYNPPLLPYEIALIEALGCTEEEYREFIRHAELTARVRPAGYEHIPDIVNGPVITPIVVSLVVGLISTAVSVLLAPKAQTIQAQKQTKIGSRKLADQIGPTRFNQTTSFDNVSALAEYGQPIPIPFGTKGTGADGITTGGLILAPALVWSRLYSYGTYQAFEGIYVAGQYGVNTPNFTGVRIGTLPLDSLGGKDFALYWSSKEANNRLSSGNLIAGSDDSLDSGTSGRNVFKAPDAFGVESDAFSMAYTPQSSTVFGTSTPIHNGTAFRFNWEIISSPYDSTLHEGGDGGARKENARREMQAKRRKIAGSEADVLHNKSPERGMPGVGRAYSRRMGFTEYNNSPFSNKTIVNNVKVGDELKYEIFGADWSELENRSRDSGGFAGTSVNLKDLENSANSWRSRASDLLVVGSKWIILDSVWVVQSRSPQTWRPGVFRQYIVFKCTAVLTRSGVSSMGIPGTDTVRQVLGGYEGPVNSYNEKKHCGAGFYNICRYNFATIRPVRRDAECVEIGLRSQVWNKASGLCNINAIPSPEDLNKFDESNITLNTPRMDKYFERTSCFSIYVRKVAEADGTRNGTWERLSSTDPRTGGLFSITGNAPVNMYNYIRIKPRTPGYYEYRFIPRTGSDVAIQGIDTNFTTELDATGGSLIGDDFDTPSHGTFRITTTGRKTLIKNIRSNPELIVDPRTTPGDTETSYKPTAIQRIASSASPNLVYLEDHSWMTQILGLAKDYRWQKIHTGYVTYEENGRSIQIGFEGSSEVYGGQGTISAQYMFASGDVYAWVKYPRVFVESSTGNWNVGEEFTLRINLNNQISNYIDDEKRSRYNYFDITFSVTAVEQSDEVTPPTVTGERIFEYSSRVSDTSHFLELTKSNESGPEHEIVYVNESLANSTDNGPVAEYYSMSTMGLAIKSNGQLNGVGQLRAWSQSGINVYRLIEKNYAPSNLLADFVYYLLTDPGQGLGNIVPSELIDTSSLEVSARFQRANHMFYDGVLEDSESIRSFIYDNASLHICNFTIKNGRFGMMPALPYDGNYKISTSPINPEQIFTSGNIIEDSLQVQYIEASQRTDFRALVTWRVTVSNDLPTQASALVDWADLAAQNRGSLTQQTFDLSDFCTNEAQALKTARFLLSIRRRVTHTLSFKTVPDALQIQPGSYIRVITSSTSYSAANNGAVTDAGELVTVSAIQNGTYDALVYYPTTSELKEQKITISNNRVTASSLYGTLFTLLSSQVNQGLYQVEQLTLDEDGLVNIAAVEVPVDSSGASIVAKDVLTESNFRVLE